MHLRCTCTATLTTLLTRLHVARGWGGVGWGGVGWGGVPKGSVVCADGARGFPASCKKDFGNKKFRVAQVNHQKNIFTKRYTFRNLWGKPYRRIIAGTQQLDSTWRHLKKWRPQSLQQKVQSGVNPMRFKWAYSYMWRHNAKCENMLNVKTLSDTLWR